MGHLYSALEYNGHTDAGLAGVRNVAVDAFGNLFISDNAAHRIRRVDNVTGLISTFAGTGTAGFSGDGGAATSAMIRAPLGIAVELTDITLICKHFNQTPVRAHAGAGAHCDGVALANRRWRSVASAVAVVCDL